MYVCYILVLLNSFYVSVFSQGIGDLTLAYQCFKLALAFNNDNAEAYNNLAVLELRKSRIEQVWFRDTITIEMLLFLHRINHVFIEIY